MAVCRMPTVTVADAVPQGARLVSLLAQVRDPGNAGTVLRSADAPSEVQRNRFAAFLKKQYGQEVPLRWEQDPALEKGFRMEVGADLYDWSLEGRLRQFRERLEQLNPAGVSVIPLMREAVRNWQPDVAPEAPEVAEAPKVWVVSPSRSVMRAWMRRPAAETRAKAPM